MSPACVAAVLLVFLTTPVTTAVRLRYHRPDGAMEPNALEPPPLPRLSGGVSIPLVRSSVDAARRAEFLTSLKDFRHRALRSALLRSTAPPMPSLSLSLLEEANVPLRRQVLSAKRLATYFGTISIAGQRFNVLFDTGSCEFWVPSVDCAAHTRPASRCAKHAAYEPRASRTYRPFKRDKKLSIQYLSGKVEGLLARDVVTIGSLQVARQVFGVADVIDVPLLDEVAWDGIVGLAYPNEALADEGVRPLFDSIIDGHLLRRNVFAYYLGVHGGELTMGGVDPKFFNAAPKPLLDEIGSSSGSGSGSASALGGALLDVDLEGAFAFASVVERGYWTIEIVDIELTWPGPNSGKAGRLPQSTGVCKGQPNGRCRAIVDTGTYLIYGPRSDVLGALGGVKVTTCADVASLPDLTFVLYFKDGENARLTLRPRDYTLEFRVLAGDGEGSGDDGDGAAAAAAPPLVDCDERSSSLGSNSSRGAAACSADCVIGIGPDNDSGWTLGQVFLRSFYSVFDRDRDRIGFARARPGVPIGGVPA